ncbi:DUF6440 family protein [Faecalibacillus intestinalis]|uniref:DUF6440 family protein n=1 Tax=Faecalibacillus intestinalis TaxID=1982626 RepID=UPI003992545F
MNKNKPKPIIIILTLVTILSVTLLFNRQSQVQAYLEYNNNRFVEIEEGDLAFLDYHILYDKKTKVEYMITEYNNKLLGVTITPLYNKDGSLLIYKKGTK